MNVYDFDGTVYDGDSTRDFLFFLIKRDPSLIRFMPKAFYAFMLYKRNSIDKTAFKEQLYTIFSGVCDIEACLHTFWQAHMRFIKSYYLMQQQESDLFISASPYFLLKPCCEKLGVQNLLASNVDPCTGKYDGKNCWGLEKVRRYLEQGYKLEDMNAFYSDSYADAPMASYAPIAYLVQGENIRPWGTREPSILKKILDYLKRD